MCEKVKSAFLLRGSRAQAPFATHWNKHESKLLFLSHFQLTGLCYLPSRPLWGIFESQKRSYQYSIQSYISAVFHSNPACPPLIWVSLPYRNVVIHFKPKWSYRHFKCYCHCHQVFPVIIFSPFSLSWMLVQDYIPCLGSSQIEKHVISLCIYCVFLQHFIFAAGLV